MTFFKTEPIPLSRSNIFEIKDLGLPVVLLGSGENAKCAYELLRSLGQDIDAVAIDSEYFDKLRSRKFMGLDLISTEIVGKMFHEVVLIVGYRADFTGIKWDSKLKSYADNGISAKRIYFVDNYTMAAPYLYDSTGFEDLFPADAGNKKEMRSYTKENPSPHYSALLEMYESMHEKGYETACSRIDGTSSYTGSTLAEYALEIKKVISLFDAKEALDYGAGKSIYYNGVHDPITIEKTNQKVDNLLEYWGLHKVDLFEPARKIDKESRKYDLVLSTDVLEHIYIADVPWVVREIFEHADKCVFATISCRFALAKLPNGQQAHITMRSPHWWNGLFQTIANDFPNVDFFLCCDGPNPKGEREKFWFRRTKHSHSVTFNDDFSN